MALFFLVPLLTGLVGGYIFKKCTDEIGYFVGIFAALCFALSLVIAPWQVLLLLLLVILITTHKLLQRVENRYENLDESKQRELNDPKHQITQEEIGRKYRGISY
jgi:predicted membrane protein